MSIQWSIRSRMKIPNRVWATWLRLLGRIGIRVHPSDKDMSAVFLDSRASLETIRDLLYEDRKILYLDRNEVRLDGASEPRSHSDSDIPRKRLEQCLSSMKDARVEAVSRHRETITFRVSLSGNSSKGFVYAPEEPVLRKTLDDHPCTAWGHAHIMLDDQWHAYYGWW
jgi:hypothetical protein